METVTVDQAIQKGKRKIYYPSLAIFFTSIGLDFFLAGFNVLPFWIIPVGFLPAILLSWLYWSLTITKWKLWAFENVRNVHELKKRAIREKLISADDSFWMMTEIRSNADSERWDALQLKFKQKDVFNDDLRIPSETFIYFSKKKIFLELIPAVILLSTGIFFITRSTAGWFGIASIIGSAVWGYFIFPKLKNRTPQIIISNKGIQTAKTDFYNWAEIKNEDVIEEGGEEVSYFLSYKHPKGSEKFNVDRLQIDWRSLAKLLILYRGRYKNSTHK
jgi:hypothetical protein